MPIISKEIILERSHFFKADEIDSIYKVENDIVISGKSVYIVENFKHRILSYRLDNKMKFIRQIGRVGQGPGDLYLPTSISLWNRTIAINDAYGFSFVKDDGTFINKFRFFSILSSFIYINDKLYCAVNNPNVFHLIEVYSTEGKRLFSFGEKFLKIDYDKNRSQGPYFVDRYFYSNIIVSDGIYIYFFNTLFGKFIKFDMEGNKIIEKDIYSYFGDFGGAVLDKNMRILKNKIEVKKGKFKKFFLFNFVSLVGDNLYIFSRPDMHPDKMLKKKGKNKIIKITVLNKKNLKLLNNYIIKISSDLCQLYSQKVVEREDKPVVYISISEGEKNGIAEYRFK